MSTLMSMAIGRERKSRGILETLNMIQLHLSLAEHMLDNIKWTEATITDEQLGHNMDVLQKYLDNADCRLSACIGNVKRITKVSE